MAAFRGSPVAGPGRSPKTQAANKRLVVPFEDNRHLTRLLGEYDSHLALIEDRLGIEAHAHGNVVTLNGPEAACEIARGVLEQLIQARVGRRADRRRRLRRPHSPCPRGERPRATGQAQIATRRRVVKARTPMQSTYIRALNKSDLVFGVGPAGTGKTYIAVAQAAHCLERGIVERIILSRPAVEAGERLGFLPGDMREKVDPYLRPLYDALYDVLPPEKVERDLESGVIEIAPLAFMRGRTLANAVRHS